MHSLKLWYTMALRSVGDNRNAFIGWMGIIVQTNYLEPLISFTHDCQQASTGRSDSSTVSSGREMDYSRYSVCQ